MSPTSLTRLFSLLFLVCLLNTLAVSQELDSSVVVCTQNLYRFGDAERKLTPEEQLPHLVARMARARCDVVALQEVYGKSIAAAKKHMTLLTEALSLKVGEPFVVVLGRSVNQDIRNGMIFRRNLVRTYDVRHFDSDNLPRLGVTPGPARSFGRAPLGVFFELVPQGNGQRRKLLVVSLHFKSRRGYKKDATRTQFESQRVEMAEAVRLRSLELEQVYGEDTVLVLAGDRNSESDSASAEVLAGGRIIEDFRKGACEIDRQLEAKCSAPQRVSQFASLFSIAQDRKRGWGREIFAGGNGSYRYRRRESLIDEILIKAEDLPLVRDIDGSLVLGLEGQYFRGSDHKLLWAKLKWPSVGIR